MSKEKMKGRCSVCQNLDEVRKEFKRSRLLTDYRMLPAPEVPMNSYYYRCKVTNETLKRDELEIERECENFKETVTFLCQECGTQNPIEYNYCGNCGCPKWWRGWGREIP